MYCRSARHYNVTTFEAFTCIATCVSSVSANIKVVGNYTYSVRVLSSHASSARNNDCLRTISSIRTTQLVFMCLKKVNRAIFDCYIQTRFHHRPRPSVSEIYDVFSHKAEPNRYTHTFIYIVVVALVGDRTSMYAYRCSRFVSVRNHPSLWAIDQVLRPIRAPGIRVI